MIEFRATLLQGVTAASRREASFLTPAWPYVPGWVVRGALAATWIRANGRPDGGQRRAEFARLFEGAVRFGPLLPDGASFEPLSVRRCKYLPEPACAHVVVDASIDPDPAYRCASCGGPLEPAKGQLLGARLTGRARVALDETGRAVDGQLFTRQEIPAGTRLVGPIDGDDPWLTGRADDVVWFGGRRSTGGRARLSVAAAAQPLAGRPQVPGRLVVRLSTPAVFLDAWCRPQLQPDVSELAAHLGVAATSLVLDAAFARPVSIGGWHAAASVPKPRDLAVAAGSTFVYRVDGVADAARHRLAASGLGERVREGFGWIQVDPPAWSPPAASIAASRPAQPGGPPEVLMALDRDVRLWISGVLRERALDAEAGLSLDERRAADIRSNVRFILQPMAVRVAIDELLRSTDLTTLRRVSNQLRRDR